ncbi:unnamed protein product [Cylindrotheca closterium]|uniref:Uncharacterized protein n=1 Tax=Cylindrotheca closterium TaxID=2856 RepID=A0AAD2CK20_9STRA|nr:unnamed protein product [Cylindrotheca closterium]
MSDKVAHSFSPPFEGFTAYGDKEVPPQHHEPYAKRPDPSKPAKTLSPDVRNNWVISPASSMSNVMQAKKEENQRRKSVLGQALPISRKVERSFQLITTTTVAAAGVTKIQVLQEDDDNDNDEEEKLPPTPVASFIAQKTGDDKFPWAFVNAETGLELACYKHKSTDFASHLEQTEAVQKLKPMDLELYGKTPLYETQKYRKKGPEAKEIIYHWGSTKIRRPTKMMFGFISLSEAIEMSTKHETPQEFKLIKGEDAGFKIILTNDKKKEVAIGEFMKNDHDDDDDTDTDNGVSHRLRLTIKPKVDPTLIIVFLAMTSSLTPDAAS